MRSFALERSAKTPHGRAGIAGHATVWVVRKDRFTASTCPRRESQRQLRSARVLRATRVSELEFIDPELAVRSIVLELLVDELVPLFRALFVLPLVLPMVLLLPGVAVLLLVLPPAGGLVFMLVGAPLALFWLLVAPLVVCAFAMPMAATTVTADATAVMAVESFFMMHFPEVEIDEKAIQSDIQWTSPCNPSCGNPEVATAMPIQCLSKLKPAVRARAAPQPGPAN